MYSAAELQKGFHTELNLRSHKLQEAVCFPQSLTHVLVFCCFSFTSDIFFLDVTTEMFYNRSTQWKWSFTASLCLNVRLSCCGSRVPSITTSTDFTGKMSLTTQNSLTGPQRFTHQIVSGRYSCSLIPVSSSFVLYFTCQTLFFKARSSYHPGVTTK